MGRATSQHVLRKEKIGLIPNSRPDQKLHSCRYQQHVYEWNWKKKVLEICYLQKRMQCFIIDHGRSIERNPLQLVLQ